MKWRKVRKKVIVDVRETNPDEKGFETLEGYKPFHKNTHFVIKGVKGELYPIRKDIFYETYEYVNPEYHDVEEFYRDED